MLGDGWDWVLLIVVLILLIGYVIYQRFCWLCDGYEDEERRR